MKWRRLCQPCWLGCLLLLAGIFPLCAGGLLHLGEGSRLIIHPGAYVSIRGELLNEDDPGRLIIRATDGAKGSLLHTADAHATIIRAFWRPALQTYMLSSPIGQRGLDASLRGPQARLFAWYEEGQGWVSVDNDHTWPTWDIANFDKDHLIPLRGYMAGFRHNADDHAHRSFSGRLNRGRVESILMRSAHEEDSHAGWNLMGNPYMSAIDWLSEAGWEGRDCLEGGGKGEGVAMWVWNEAYGNFGLVHTTAFSTRHNKAGELIAPMQAFWVRAAQGAHQCVLAVNDQARLHMDVSAAKHRPPPPKQDQGILRLQAIGEEGRDELILEFGHQANSLAAHKMFSLRADVPQVYAMENGEAYSLLFLEGPPGDVTVDFRLLPGASKSLELVVVHDPAFPAHLYLEQLDADTVHALAASPALWIDAGQDQKEDGKEIPFRLHIREKRRADWE